MPAVTPLPLDVATTKLPSYPTERIAVLPVETPVFADAILLTVTPLSEISKVLTSPPLFATP